jgi:hypothetical protein
MKKITLIACTVAIAFSLAAFTYSNWNGTPTHQPSCQKAIKIEPPAFSFNLSSRGNNSISKETMHSAKTIADFMPDFSIQKDLNNNTISVRDVVIRIEEENVDPTKHKSEKGNGNILSKEQKDLLKSTDYSTNFFLEGFLTNNSLIRDENNDRYFNYYMTVVPEQQATYKGGNKAFVDYLTTNCQPTIEKMQKGNLKFGNISFMVTKDGTISNIEINSTCGYPSVDQKMVELMDAIPDVWNVATNGVGEKVNQTLVFSYGQGGC